MTSLESLRAALPSHLQERLRLSSSAPIRTGPVLYWMRSCLRGHENPALDAAVAAAGILKTAVVVLVHLEDQYPHATARRQQFLLQGVRSAQEELKTRGFPHVLVQVDRRGHRPALHLELAKKCAMVVAEEPFCVPFLKGVEELRAAPLWLLDCASVVPSALVPKGACHRAYAYEKATEYLHTKHAAHKWEDAKLEQGAVLDFELPPCNDLQHPDEVLLKDMEVDHSVAPVSHTPGGSSAGYARWNSWVAGGGLKTYAKRRNESLDVHGVSRMSAYLNAGMVSPMRIARLASTATGAGKAKFLNEFLTWRGICYSHFYHFPMHSSGATVAQLPPWAQQTLQEHAKDSRQVLPLEQLASAKSGDAAWDGMQRYLIETGELHNNARMGWGKAVCRWTESPQAAIDALIALNNIFALDGHAPPSYGGLLGCLGLFEGPKQDSAILGKVSHRSPKAKYATLPDVAGELMRAGKQEAGIARFFGRAVENSLEPQPKRRWVRKLGPDGTIALD